MQLHVRMSSRDPEEAHRAATPLELFFDLTFVVAVAQAASGLHHGLIEGHAGDALVAFPLVFFGIWWAWMNFTWFASAYDTDDAAYRLAVLVLMAGVLIMAAGVPRVFDGGQFGVVVAGYVVMRLAMVGLWLRAAASHPEGRSCALRYAAGIAVLQVGWVARLALPASVVGAAAFLALAAAELAVPTWAERHSRTSWHPHHIVERYSLFTIIVLGEAILAATIGAQAALDDQAAFGGIATIVVGGLLIVFSMWWIYFDMPAEEMVEWARTAFSGHLSGAFWGYGHYVVFASAAAAGAGLAVAADQATHHSELTDLQAGFAVTAPVALYLVAVWALHFSSKRPGWLRDVAVPVTATLILAASATPEPVLATGVLLAALVAVGVAANRAPRPDAAASSEMVR